MNTRVLQKRVCRTRVFCVSENKRQRNFTASVSECLNTGTSGDPDDFSRVDEIRIGYFVFCGKPGDRDMICCGDLRQGIFWLYRIGLHAEIRVSGDLQPFSRIDLIGIADSVEGCQARYGRPVFCGNT